MTLTLELKKPKVVLFDWDDTLVSTGKFYRTFLKEVLAELEITEWDREAEETYRHYARREALPKIFGDNWKDVNDAFVKKVQHMHNTHEIHPLPDALNAIKNFAEDGVIMSVVSNKDGKHLREDVTKLGWGQYFHKIIGASDAMRDKPWPDPVEMALEGIEFTKSDDIWFVGDSIVDMQCAVATNCSPVLISTDHATKALVHSVRVRHAHFADHMEFMSHYNAI